MTLKLINSHFKSHFSQRGFTNSPILDYSQTEGGVILK